MSALSKMRYTFVFLFLFFSAINRTIVGEPVTEDKMGKLVFKIR